MPSESTLVHRKDSRRIGSPYRHDSAKVQAVRERLVEALFGPSLSSPSEKINYRSKHEPNLPSLLSIFLSGVKVEKRG